MTLGHHACFEAHLFLLSLGKYSLLYKLPQGRNIDPLHSQYFNLLSHPRPGQFQFVPSRVYVWNSKPAETTGFFLEGSSEKVQAEQKLFNQKTFWFILASIHASAQDSDITKLLQAIPPNVLGLPTGVILRLCYDFKNHQTQVVLDEESGMYHGMFSVFNLQLLSSVCEVLTIFRNESQFGPCSTSSPNLFVNLTNGI